jgi:GDP/UDP-N,N'-diacetylbacillosamine 2-epimerase (hydrolysing)
MSRKVCVVTGTRAEYGLLYFLIEAINTDPDLELQLVATGMHLSPEFGLTYKEIEKDFCVDKKIEMLLSSDTPIGVSKSMGLAQISFSEVFADLQPELLLVLGDRYEIFSAVSAAMIARIPVAHLHGGESTEGLIDEAIRHCITKMSHLHFTSTESYRQRVIQLGESPNRVFNFGALGIDNIKRLELLSQPQLEKSIGMQLGERNLLITFHPVTLENDTARAQFQALLDAICGLEKTKFVFTKANSDTGGRIVNQMIDEFVRTNSNKAVAFDSLGRLRYLSSLQYVDAVVGNSSSGLLEAPSFKIATVNIGDRQKGRVKSESVIDCFPDTQSITRALAVIYSKGFQQKLGYTSNPYGEGGASEKILDVIKRVDLSNIIKKNFHDVEEC